MDKKPVHEITKELQKALKASKIASATWSDITPLAQNEWICWTSSAKKVETRTKRIKQAVEMLEEGKRRPCCWPGCPHRKGSKSAKWFK